MSSMITQVRPSTSPMMFITSATLAFGRRLSMIARSRVEPLGERARAHHAADVGRDDDQVRRSCCFHRSPSSTGDA